MSRGKLLDPNFWGNIRVGTSDECWPWLRATTDGYGVLNINGKQWRAHRYAYVLTYGSIADGMFVCHKCDNPICCNPAHLWLGTLADNHRDMTEKRRNIGRRQGASKRYTRLSDQDVVDIRQRAEAGEPYGSIARHYRIDLSTASLIARGLRRKAS